MPLLSIALTASSVRLFSYLAAKGLKFKPPAP